MDAVELTRNLIAFDTTNPPGREAECAGFIATWLLSRGFEVETHMFDEVRMNLVARLQGATLGGDPLVLTGHIDTVPIGSAPWSCDPFAGEIRDGRLYGRGASDMKSGVAAMLVAAEGWAARRAELNRGVTLVLTAGEETGCTGALRLLSDGPGLGGASALLVGEPTGNRVSTGHKGCIAVQARTVGVTAHSSMPDKGVNAIYRAARAIAKIEHHRVEAPAHALLGSPTINVGMMGGGLNYNSVPDAAQFTVDVRSIPGLDHAMVVEGLRTLLGEEVVLQPFVDMPSVSVDPSEPFVRCVQAAQRRQAGGSEDSPPLGIPYFSDASVLAPHLGCPAVILGPGEPDLAHQTDEYCLVRSILDAVDIYDRIIGGWCAGSA